MTLGRVNPLVPLGVGLVGLGCFVYGLHFVGAGIAIGAVLGLMNGLFLSRRVDIAAGTGDIGRALMVMQLGLLVAVTIIGITTVVLVHFSVSMAVACAIGFLVTHLGMLAAFYLLRGRSNAPLERNTL